MTGDDPSRPPGDPVRTARERNRQALAQSDFGTHRHRTMECLRGARVQVPAAQATLTVFGPGNCMDLDLQELGRLFSDIHLLDVDLEAVTGALQRQRPHHPDEPNSTRFVPMEWDLAAPLFELLPGTTTAGLWSGECTSDAIVETAERVAAPFPAIPVPTADVVVSTCVLSQILEALATRIPTNHPGYLTLVQAVRRGHVTRMLQMLKPGGCGVLVTDLVSSESLPSLQTATPDQLPEILMHSLAAGNFFTGLHPGILMRDLQDAHLFPDLTSAAMHDPWLWSLGIRLYAVCAVSFQRRSITERD